MICSARVLFFVNELCPTQKDQHMPKRFFLLLLIVAALSFEAARCDEICPTFQIGAEYLYLNPTIDRTTFALSNQFSPTVFLLPIPTTPPITTTNFGGKSIKNEFNYHSGCSVFGTYYFNKCSDFTIEWNRLHCSDSADFTGDYFPTRGDPFVFQVYLTPIDFSPLIWVFGLFEGNCHAHSDFKFDNLELLFGQLLVANRCFDLQLRGGVNLAQIKIHEKFTYISFPTDVAVDPFTLVILNVQDHSNFRGVGPQIGLDMNYYLTKRLYLRGAANASLLVSQLSKKSITNLFFTTPTLSFTNSAAFRDRRHYKIVPEVDLQFGIGIETCVFGFLANLEAGFEAFAFFNAQQNYHFNDFNAAEADSVSNINLHGLYVSASVGF